MTLCSRLFLSLSLLATVACGGDSGDSEPASVDARPPAPDAAPDAEVVPLTDVGVTVVYEGAHSGGLVVGAFLDDPPMGPPLAFVQDDAPVFPASITLRALEPNTYYVIAVLDRDPASPSAPGPEDLQIVSDPLVIDGDDEPSLTLTITDPEEK